MGASSTYDGTTFELQDGILPDKTSFHNMGTSPFYRCSYSTSASIDWNGYVQHCASCKSEHLGTAELRVFVGGHVHGLVKVSSLQEIIIKRQAIVRLYVHCFAAVLLCFDVCDLKLNLSSSFVICVSVCQCLVLEDGWRNIFRYYFRRLDHLCN